MSYPNFTAAELELQRALMEMQDAGPSESVAGRVIAAISALVSEIAGSASTSILVQASGPITTNTLIKTGPGKIIAIVQTAGAGVPTVRDGTVVSGALIPGWGSGGASGLVLTANTPYNLPVDVSNGIFVEINGTATVFVVYA